MATNAASKVSIPLDFPKIYQAQVTLERRTVPAIRINNSNGTALAAIVMSGYRVGIDPSQTDWARRLTESFNACRVLAAPLTDMRTIQYALKSVMDLTDEAVDRPTDPVALNAWYTRRLASIRSVVKGPAGRFRDLVD